MATGFLQKATRHGASKALWVLYSICAISSAYIIMTGTRDALINNAYGLILGTIPLLGGIYGLSLSRSWGAFRSALGKSLIFLSLGLISWAVGTYIFSGYYNLYASVEVPYPSLADLAYIISWPLWGISMYYLSKASGARFGMKASGGKWALLGIPFIVACASYYLLIIVAREGAIVSDTDLFKVFFDLFYPIGDVAILTAAALVYALSYQYLGGIFKTAIYTVLFGFGLNYIADFLFSYTTTLGTFYAGGGVDFLFTTTVFVLSLGVTMLDPRFLSASENT